MKKKMKLFLFGFLISPEMNGDVGGLIDDEGGRFDGLGEGDRTAQPMAVGRQWRLARIKPLIKGGNIKVKEKKKKEKKEN